MCHRKKQIPTPTLPEYSQAVGNIPEIDPSHYKQSATEPIPQEMPGRAAEKAN